MEEDKTEDLGGIRKRRGSGEKNEQKEKIIVVISLVPGSFKYF